MPVIKIPPFMEETVAALTKERLQMLDQMNEESLNPAIYEEFLLCNSEYEVSDKSSSECISSDGEFNDANKIQVFFEDDSAINHIEHNRERKKVLLYQENAPYYEA
jgi:hypothetical protein